MLDLRQSMRRALVWFRHTDRGVPDHRSHTARAEPCLVLRPAGGGGNSQQPIPARGNRPKVAAAILLATYFLCFQWGSLRVHFALDDLGNIAHYYEYSPWQRVIANILLWRGDVRPLGALFYLPVYHFAGLNPVPYQAVLLLLVAAAVYFAYRFTRLLGTGERPAALVALVFCYHGGVANLYYNAAFVYDVLCCLFYLACFVYYMRIRNQGRLLGAGQTVAFLALFVCALNSKEMAVSIPVMLLVYEWIYHRPVTWKRVTWKRVTWNRADLWAWVRGPARVGLIAAALNAVDIYGKISGPNAMTNAASYRPVFTLERVRDFQIASLQDLFFCWTWTPGWGQILAIWAILAFLAWRRGSRPILRFLFWFLIVAPLPIEFLPGKRQACLVLPMVGGAAFVAVVFVDAVDAIARFVGRGFGLKPAGRSLLAGVMIAAAVFIWVRDQYTLRQSIGGVPMTSLGFETWDLIQQLRASGFHPRPGSSAAFLDDPFVDRLDMYRLARLWLHDGSVAVHVAGQGPLSPQDLAKVDYIFTIQNRQLIRLK